MRQDPDTERKGLPLVNWLTRWIRDHARQEGPLAHLLDDAVYVAKRGSALLVPDKWYVTLNFLIRTGRLPDLARPRTFSEKIQWLKLNCRSEQLIRLADKLAVREYVADRVGVGMLVPIHRVYETVGQIRLSQLPDRFVLKPTHGSGWVIVCRDKREFDWEAARRKLGRWMRRNYYYSSREWWYKHIPRRIICEKLLLDARGQVPNDYKIFCFDGEPELIQVDIDRFTRHTRNFYDTSWKRLPFELLHAGSDRDVPRPEALQRLLAVARELARGFPFCRVDLYVVDGHVYFGELTFSPGNGTEPFRPAAFDRVLGERMIHLERFAGHDGPVQVAY